MFAAFKEDCSAYVIFMGGNSSDYPQWFLDFMDDAIYEDEYRYNVINNVSGALQLNEKDSRNYPRYWPDVLTEGYDAFLKNHRGWIRRTNVEDIEEYFEEIAPGVVCLKSDVVEYVRYTGESDIYPEWFVKEITDTGVLTRRDDILFFNGTAGDSLAVMSDKGRCIFIRNRFGDIRYLEDYEFDRLFYHRNNSSPSNF